MGAADHFAAELDQPAVGKAGLFHPAADSVACLDDEDVRSAGGEVAGRGESGEPGAQDDDVVVHTRSLGAVFSRPACPSSTRQCSGFQPISTLSPPLQRSSIRERSVFCSRTETVMPGASSMR